MKRIFYFCTVIIATAFWSCDVDFDPNTEWQEQMVVYCLLDQQDDTTFVRVEKCFLGNGDATKMAKIKDSIYYGKDDLQVKLIACPVSDTNNVSEVFNFTYAEISHSSTNFYSGDDCPIYYCVTKGKLNLQHYYKLEITNLKTGKTVIGRTYLLADHSINNSTFSFYISDGTVKGLNNSLNIEWTNFNGSNLMNEMIGKQFQVGIRFNYVKDGRVEHIDIPRVTRTNNYYTPITMSAAITINDVLDGISSQLKNETKLKWYLTAPFEIWVTSGNLSLYDYISINSNSSSLTYTPAYSNIEGGLGLFAARRNHISKSFKNDLVDSKLQQYISELGIFE